MLPEYLSWGRVFRHDQQIKKPQWLSELKVDFAKDPRSFLGFGLGRSYGDSCLNDHGILVDMSSLRRMIHFDANTGILKCEAGLSLGEIIDVFLPRGWFPPVVPGTKFVTVAGAIANDIHGKNHHKAGTFGCHVMSFDLLRSDGVIYHCSPSENRELFCATIGGLGLTGLILCAEIKLIAVESPYYSVDTIKTQNPEEYFRLVDESDADFDYTVSWIDATARNSKIGRGLFMRGKVSPGKKEDLAKYQTKSRPSVAVPFESPVSFINYQTCRLFNTMYFNKQRRVKISGQQSYDNFFFPLDKIAGWNLAYGRKGFFQYQFVVPIAAKEAISSVLKCVGDFGMGSFLTVLKSFGAVQSPGLMSFPMHGPTLTLDVPNHGATTLDQFKKLDDIVAEAGGRIYPAKDARMDAAFFQKTFPNFSEFSKYVDPKFSSSFWRRVKG